MKSAAKKLTEDTDNGLAPSGAPGLTRDDYFVKSVYGLIDRYPSKTVTLAAALVSLCLTIGWSAAKSRETLQEKITQDVGAVAKQGDPGAPKAREVWIVEGQIEFEDEFESNQLFQVVLRPAPFELRDDGTFSMILVSRPTYSGEVLPDVLFKHPGFETVVVPLEKLKPKEGSEYQIKLEKPVRFLRKMRRRHGGVDDVIEQASLRSPYNENM